MNKIDTDNMECHAQREPNVKVHNATYIPPARVGLALGPWVLPSGPCVLVLGQQVFIDINMLVSATQNTGIGSQAQREPPKRAVLRCSGIDLTLPLKHFFFLSPTDRPTKLL